MGLVLPGWSGFRLRLRSVREGMTTMMNAARVDVPLDDQTTIVLLDVDGVVNLWMGARNVRVPGGYDTYQIGHHWGPLRIPRRVRSVVQRFVDDGHDVRWCTAWREHANRFVSPVLEIPTLRVITDGALGAHGADWKLEQVIRLAMACDNPIVWIEDFEASWADPGLVHECLSSRVRLVDTSRIGYLRAGMLEDLYDEGVL